MESPTVAVYLQDLPPDSSDGRHAISKEESEFLSAIRAGNIRDVQSYILSKSVDVNCVSLLGETALQVAVNNDHADVAKLLLENGADLGLTLLQAVRKNSITCVKTLLEFDDVPHHSERILPSVGGRTTPIQYKKYISPLVLAAENGNPEIISLLLSKGYTISAPPFHNRSCLCEECEGLGQRLGTSLFRLHTYGALASPVYLCLSYLLSDSGARSTEDQEMSCSKDPIIRAFLLNKKLEELVYTEYEFGKNYKKLSNRCEEFAVSLLTECRSMEEIGCVMSVPGIDKMDHMVVSGGSEAQKLSVLNFAIANKNEKFVAHPYSQLMLNSVLYQGLGRWESLHFSIKLLLGLIYALLLPLWAVVYLLAPGSGVSTLLRKPLFKFLSHTSSLCWFLMILILSSVQDKFVSMLQFSVLDFLLTFWIAGMLFQESKELFRQGKERYFSQLWNIASLAMLSLFVLAGVLWLTGYVMIVSGEGVWAIPIRVVFGGSQQETAFRLILTSNGLFALGLVLSFFQASNLFQVSSILGPLQLSLINMTRDIAKFLFLFLLLYLAFGWAERKVYSQYALAREQLVGNATEHGFAKIGGALRYLFWDLFGLSELDDLETDQNFKITQYTGEILLGLYSIVSIIVAINMLIAMMANSYQRVADDADIQWKFSRTRMWMQYVDSGSVLPPPFNLIPPPYLIIRLIRRLCACPIQGGCYGESHSSNSSRLKNKVDTKQRHNVMKRLVQRYLSTLEKAGHESNACQTQSVTHDDHCQLKNDHGRGVLEPTENGKPSRMTKPDDNTFL